MKIFSMLTLATAAYALTDQELCSKKRYGKSNVLAIQGLCAKTNMVVPSTYAQKGHKHGGQKAAIQGNCSPAQWVPQYWCLKQFYDLCAHTTDDKGEDTKKFGSNGCQSFYITGHLL
ncbi:hypothetical protein LTR08_002935 [Meristemomyces frigidus]|nr:hypothetical protein LTR08_002935 [Meristemomyces frigidus]